MADTIGEKGIRRDYPVDDGIVSGTTTQEGHKMQLEAQGINGVKSTVLDKERTGFN